MTFTRVARTEALALTQLKELEWSGEHFSVTLDRFITNITTDRVTLGALMSFLGSRSIAAMLLFLSLPMALPIPAPGLSVLFGIPLILISSQLVVGMQRAWLPARLAQRSITRGDFQMLVSRCRPTLHGLERFVRPRITWLAGDWAMIPIGAICLVLAIIITLPVPFGHMVPGLAISVLALGLLERDGLTVGLGIAIAAAAGALVTVGSAGIVLWVQTQLG